MFDWFLLIIVTDRAFGIALVLRNTKMKRFTKSLRKIYSNTKKDQRCLMVQRHSAKMVLSRVAYGLCQVRVHLIVWICVSFCIDYRIRVWCVKMFRGL